MLLLVKGSAVSWASKALLFASKVRMLASMPIMECATKWFAKSAAAHGMRLSIAQMQLIVPDSVSGASACAHAVWQAKLLG